ncbi:hypothetical protein [Nocardia neocaledoniensis]|uniref:hypothetical protein n=1 Tax=Nocardia neocaledoniensis TaxID=236511 RepID=UPI0024573836|nr:hypothetical protein [Nocardia neocaledoniensis]
MSTGVLSVVGESTALAVWPVTAFLGVVFVVTVIALVRAERNDVPRIFAAFVGGFGFRTGPAGEEDASTETEEGALEEHDE